MYTFHAWWYQTVIVGRRTRRWCKSVLFDWSQDFPIAYSRQTFFRDLAASPDYHNAVLFPGTELLHAPEAHGPFLTRRITPDRFVTLQPAQYRMRLRQVLYRQEFYPPDTAAASYIEGAFEGGWSDDTRFFELCLVHDFTHFRQPGFKIDFPCGEQIAEFTEFVCVMTALQRVCLVMFGID